MNERTDRDAGPQMLNKETNDSKQKRKDTQRGYGEPKIKPDISAESFKTEQDSSVTQETG